MMPVMLTKFVEYDSGFVELPTLKKGCGIFTNTHKPQNNKDMGYVVRLLYIYNAYVELKRASLYIEREVGITPYLHTF